MATVGVKGLSRRRTLQKLVPVVWHQKLARVSVNLLQVFFWYQFLTQNETQLCSITETVRHLTRTVQRNWPESCFGARNCGEVASNFSCKFLVPDDWYCTSFWSVCRRHNKGDQAFSVAGPQRGNVFCSTKCNSIKC